MGSMGSWEPINFEKWVPGTHQFLEVIYKHIIKKLPNFQTYISFCHLLKTKITSLVRVHLVRVFIQSFMPSVARPTQNENLSLLIVFMENYQEASPGCNI